MCDKYVIGYCLSEKKRQKLNWNDLQKVCETDGFLLKMIYVDLNLESQGPFHIFVHKLTETLAHAENGDQNAKAVISRVREYVHKHPELIVIDPLENIKNLYNRYKSYEIMQENIHFNDIFIPNFVEIRSKNIVENTYLLKKKGIKFPFVCKPLLAHGSSDAHELMLIFNKKDLKDCRPPCVAQNFINHNAILYKVFIVGEHFHVVKRPSFKNFYQEDCASLNTLFFNRHDICNADSRSKWSILSEENIPPTVKPNFETFEKIAKEITKIFSLCLVGVDVVIENNSGKYAIIDVNVFPGYDGYPNFFQHLMEYIKKMLTKQRVCMQNPKNCTLKKCASEDLDFGFESDEKRKYTMK